MAFNLRRFFRVLLNVGAHADRASVTAGGFASLPLATFAHRASGDAAVQRSAAAFPSPRFPCNVSRRHGLMGRAMMPVRACFGATRAVRYRGATAVDRVTRAGNGGAVSASAAVSPNPAVNRTVSGVCPSAHAGTAGYLAR